MRAMLGTMALVGVGVTLAAFANVDGAPNAAPSASASSFAPRPSLSAFMQAVASDAGATDASFDRSGPGRLPTLDVQSCKRVDGPMGAGHLTITFAPDGHAEKVVGDSAPFAGTPRSRCPLFRGRRSASARRSPSTERALRRQHLS